MGRETGVMDFGLYSAGDLLSWRIYRERCPLRTDTLFTCIARHCKLDINTL